MRAYQLPTCALAAALLLTAGCRCTAPPLGYDTWALYQARGREIALERAEAITRSELGPGLDDLEVWDVRCDGWGAPGRWQARWAGTRWYFYGWGGWYPGCRLAGGRWPRR